MDLDELQRECERVWRQFSRNVEESWDAALEYFEAIPEDEDVAWGAIGVGVFLCVLGFILA